MSDLLIMFHKAALRSGDGGLSLLGLSGLTGIVSAVESINALAFIKAVLSCVDSSTCGFPKHHMQPLNLLHCKVE